MSVQNAGTNGRNRYLDLLDEAWQAHLAPREPDAPTVISLFAGCGGSSLGYSMAGYRELLAVEWNDNAVETFKLNFPGIPVYHGDIHELTVNECLQLAGIGVGELDVLDGSPPCQGFSTAGKRNLMDPRNDLSFEFIRLLRGLKPKTFIMENVSGMVKGKMKLVFAEVMKELKASGYQTRCKLLNAMYFNVPQSRQRLIWIGVRDDLGILPSYILPTSELVSAGSVCPELAEAIAISWRRPNGRHTYRTLSEPAPTIDKVGGHIEVNGMRKPWPLFAVRRLSSFPERFEFLGQKSQQLKRIGNSVPPLFMRAIAEHVRMRILSEG